MEEWEKEEVKEGQIVRVYNIEPSKYREINQVCKKIDKVVLEVLVGVIVNEEHQGLEAEQFSALEFIDPEQGEEEAREEKKEKKEVVKAEKKEEGGKVETKA